MTKDGKQELIVGISSQALFRLREEGAISRAWGPRSFFEYQRAQEDTPLEPGAGFALVKQLLEINDSDSTPQKISIVILSPNTGDSSLRIFRSLEFHSLPNPTRRPDERRGTGSLPGAVPGRLVSLEQLRGDSRGR